MPEGWTLEDWLVGEVDEEPERYVLNYQDVYVNFNSPDFIQGVHTAFLWLDFVPELPYNIYDTLNKTWLTVN